MKGKIRSKIEEYEIRTYSDCDDYEVVDIVYPSNVHTVLNTIEDMIGDILNELETVEGDKRDNIDIDTVIKLVRQLKDDLY